MRHLVVVEEVLVSAPSQAWHRRPYVPVLIVLVVIVVIMAVLAFAQRDRAGNEPLPDPGGKTFTPPVATRS